MNKKNLIILILIGANLLFGIILLIIGLIGGDVTSMKDVAFPVGLGSFIGAAIQFWRIKESIMGRSVFSFIVYAVIVLVSFSLTAFKIWPFAIALLVLAGICAFNAFKGLKTDDTSTTVTE